MPARRRRVAFGCLLALGVLLPLPAAFVVSTLHRIRTVDWQASVAVREKDCSQAGICRAKASTDFVERDANRAAYRVRTNALGFRGPDRTVARGDPRTLRVALFGDSMIYGIGVSEGDTLADALQSELSRRFPDRPVEVQNFGLPMNYLTSSATIYRAFARPFAPDAVVFRAAGGFDNPHDLNDRVRQMRQSSLLSWLLEQPGGPALVNFWQVGTMEWYRSGQVKTQLRAALGPLAEDQRARGLVVLLYAHWTGDVTAADLGGAMPEGLAYDFGSSGLTRAEYAAGPYCLHGDGHPTPEGNRFFAGQIADGLEAPLRRARP